MSKHEAGRVFELARPLRSRSGVIWSVVVVFFAAAYVTSESAAGALLYGAAAGALVSAIALGVVLTYKGSGVVNFAAGATAMYTTYIYMALRADGDYVTPPVPNPLVLIEWLVKPLGADIDLLDWPERISLGDPMGFLPAAALALLTAAVLGLLMHFLVYKPLRSAPPLAKVVASVGLLVLLQALVLRRFGSTPFALEAVLPRESVSMPRGVTISSDQLYAVLIVAVITAALWAVFKFTRFGIAARANADNEKSIVLLGHSPNRLAAITWVMSSVLVGFMGIMVSTINSGVDSVTMVLLVVPALAAALIGNFTSFGLTVAAGIAISMGQGLIQTWSLESWFPKTDGAPMPGVGQIVPLIVIIAVVVLRGTSIPSRSTASALRMPHVPVAGSTRTIIVKSMVILVLATAFLLMAGPEWRLGVVLTAVFAVLAMGLVVVTGYVGQISLAQLSIAGAAGFAVSKFTVEAGWMFPFGAIAAVLFATLVGFVISVVSLRVRGIDLAIVTLAIAVASEVMLFANPKLAGPNYSAPVPAPSIGGVSFGPADDASWSLIGFAGDGKVPNPWFGVFCVVVAILMAAVVLNFRRSRSGRLSLAVRSNERATASAGVSVARIKVIAFSMGAFLAGVGGVLYGYAGGSVSATSFNTFACLTLLVYAYLGGISSVGGAVTTGLLSAGGLGAVALNQWFDLAQADVLMLGAVALVITVVLSPEGIAGEMRRVGGLLGRLLGGRPMEPAGPVGAAPTDELLADLDPIDDTREEVRISGRNA